jgi:hypothetical protein
MEVSRQLHASAAVPREKLNDCNGQVLWLEDSIRGFKDVNFHKSYPASISEYSNLHSSADHYDKEYL